MCNQAKQSTTTHYASGWSKHQIPFGSALPLPLIAWRMWKQKAFCQAALGSEEGSTVLISHSSHLQQATSFHISERENVQGARHTGWRCSSHQVTHKAQVRIVLIKLHIMQGLIQRLKNATSLLSFLAKQSTQPLSLWIYGFPWTLFPLLSQGQTPFSIVRVQFSSARYITS